MKQKYEEPAYPQRNPKKTHVEVALAAAKAQLDENAKELAALRAEVDNYKKIAENRTRELIRIEKEYGYALSALEQYGIFSAPTTDEIACPLQFGVDIALAGWLKAEAASRIEDAYRKVSWKTKPEPPTKA